MTLCGFQECFVLLTLLGREFRFLKMLPSAIRAYKKIVLWASTEQKSGLNLCGPGENRASVSVVSCGFSARAAPVLDWAKDFIFRSL